MPPESTDVNIYHLDEKARKKLKIDMLPGSLMDSHNNLLKDQVLRTTLGEHIMDTLTRIVIQETDAFRLAVHPWELDRYLPTY
jgi:glutamine synthetase